MDRVRRLFSNLQCCKSGTEGDNLKSSNDKYLIHVVDGVDDDLELKALSSPSGSAGGSSAYLDPKQISLLRSKSCPEILEHNYDGDEVPSGDGKWGWQPPPLPPVCAGVGVGGGRKCSDSGDFEQQLQMPPSLPSSTDAQLLLCERRSPSEEQEKYQHHLHHNQRRRRQKQHQHLQHHQQLQRRSADECHRWGVRGSRRVDCLQHAAAAAAAGGAGGGGGGDYGGAVNLPHRIVWSAPGGVGRS